MKILVLTCSDPNMAGLRTGSCPSAQRTWQELEIPDITFWESLITTFTPEMFSLILLASMTGVATGFGMGLLINMARRGRAIL